MSLSIKNLVPGQPTISARDFNRLFTEVRKLANLTVTSPLTMSKGTSGIILGSQASAGSGWRIAKADSSIAAMSGSNPGSGTVSLYDVDSSTGALTDSTDNETAYNIAGSAVISGAWIMIRRESASGLWFLDFEDCG